ncbi:MAG: TrkH family potassium uptake protein [Candidatus Adiutrix intracellularis]|nr:TrkH family potassium uptake protein [Candidatus Adiutrix intracellularis]
MNLAVNLYLVCGLCGWVLLFLALIMGLMVIPALVIGDGMAEVFFKSALVVSLCAGLLIRVGRRAVGDELRKRDGLAVVGLSWLMVSLLGALPYLGSGVIFTFADALFESVSGFSTTGVTILTSLAKLSPIFLFWRCLTLWLGGMGIIMLMLAVLPFFGLGGVHFFKNESSMGQERFKPRVVKMVKFLWLTYITLTILLLFLLRLGHLSWFEAVCYSFSIVSTGGFVLHDNSISYYDSCYLENISMLFMFLSSLNFVLYYQIIQGNWRGIFLDSEVRTFVLIIGVCSLAIVIVLLGTGFYDAPLTALRYALFQVVSVISTTGFFSTDWEQWPSFCQGLLLALFFVGGCSGSTSGGLKCVRWILLFKGIRRTFSQYIHPRAVIGIHLEKTVVPEEVMIAVWSFSSIYIIIFIISALVLAAFGLDLLTAFSASASALGNVGLGLQAVGPTDSFASFPSLAKIILSLEMILGRLEVFSFLILFIPGFWKS